MLPVAVGNSVAIYTNIDRIFCQFTGVPFGFIFFVDYALLLLAGCRIVAARAIRATSRRLIVGGVDVPRRGDISVLIVGYARATADHRFLPSA